MIETRFEGKKQDKRSRNKAKHGNHASKSEATNKHVPELDGVPTPYAHPNPSSSDSHNPRCHAKHGEEVD